MMKVFISDLHLGCGDERDDFLYLGNNTEFEKLRDPVVREKGFRAMHELFGRFIDHLLATSRKKSESI